MENNFDCLMLASGGMESTVLAYKLAKENKNVVIFFIDYGQHCKDKEYQTLLQVLPEEYVDNVRVIKIGDVYKESGFCLGLYGFEQLILYYASHTEQEESEEKSGYFMLKKCLTKEN